MPDAIQTHASTPTRQSTAGGKELRRISPQINVHNTERRRLTRAFQRTYLHTVHIRTDCPRHHNHALVPSLTTGYPVRPGCTPRTTVLSGPPGLNRIAHHTLLSTFVISSLSTHSRWVCCPLLGPPLAPHSWSLCPPPHPQPVDGRSQRRNGQAATTSKSDLKT